ncbi:MAG: cell division protein FtsH, partial [Pseudanabaena sp. CoA8_M7]|nr:cell division protein FtsH [Pseudanabaena sp. CoA8_M7]
VSPATSEAIDKEIKTIVENAHAKALAILNANRDLLESISEKLLETEVIEGEFLSNLLAQVKPLEVNA